MRVLAFLMVFFVLISPFYGIKKVKANPVAIGGSAIVALILSGLAAQGLISGEYKVTAAQLTQINDLAQAQLALEGATAVAAAQKLGDALAAGAESAKIKALATGGVIYAFLTAIQETLFIKDYSSSVPSGLIFVGAIKDKILVQTHAKYMAPTSGYNVGYKEITGNLVPAAEHFNVPVPSNYGNYNYDVSQFRLYESDGAYSQILVASNNSDYNSGYHVFLPYTAIGNCAGAILGITERVQLADAGIIYDPTINKISERDSVVIPTVLPSVIVENVNNWDGTSDLVLAPPLPYDVPDDESLVVDPTYGGEVIDPTDPVDPPAEEEGISLPWLSALLALLGLGKLTGIDEGVLSGIDSIVDGITSTIQDVIDGVKTTAGEWATAATAAITTAISGIQSGISSIADTISHAFDPPSKDIDWDKLKSSGSVIFTKFPFSIPADLKFLVGLLVSDPQAPKWTVTVPFSIVGDWAQDGEFVLDFSVIDGFMVIVRNIELLAFIFGMVFMTRQLIWK